MENQSFEFCCIGGDGGAVGEGVAFAQDLVDACFLPDEPEPRDSGETDTCL